MADGKEEFLRLVGREPVVEAPAPQAPPDESKSRFLELVGRGPEIGGQNAPPSTVSATPQMDATQLYGRRNKVLNELIPVDQDTGISLGDYWHISPQSDPEAKAQALQKLYPESVVRVLDTGDVTMEVRDPQGKPKDVVINPRGISREDLLDLYAQSPELGASLATAVLTQGRGALRTVAQLILSAGAGATVGGARDAGERAFAGIDVRPGDIFRERGTQAALDVGLGGAGALAGKATRALSPFAREAQPGSLAFNLKEGSDFLKRNYNVDLTLTPGQRTGNPSLQAIEASEAPMPGSRSVMGRINARNEEAIQRLQSLATGQVTPEEQIGVEAIGTLRKEVVEPLEAAVTSAREKAIASGDKRIVDLLDEALGTPSGQRVTPTQAGEATLKSFDERLAVAQQRVDEAYAKVNELPGGTGDVLDGTAAANAAQEIRKELPSVEKSVEKPTGLLDESGQPLTREVQESQVLGSGVPEGLMKALSDLESLRGGKVSLQTLTNMKKAAYDAIAAFRTAHGDVKDRWFTKLAGAYERGIQEGIDATENLELKQALATARDTYKKELVPFERAGVKELAKEEVDAGRLSPEQVMTRLFEGPKAIENYRLLKDTLGANDPAFRILKRAWGDSVIAEVTDPVTQSLNPSKLANRLQGLAVDRPELAQELLGKNYRPLMATLKVRSAIEGLDNLDEGAVKTLLNLKDPSVADFKMLVEMTAKRDQAYVNGILKDIGDGLPLNGLNPTQFVSKLRNARTPTSEVETVLQSVTPAQREAIATAEFYRLLNEASVSEGATAVRALKGEPVNLSATKLVKAYGTGDEAKRTTLLLGEDLPAPGAPPPKPGDKTVTRADVIEALAKTLAPKEAAKTAFHNMAGLRSGTAVAQLLNDGPLKYASGFAKRMLLATAYVKGLGKVLTNTQFDSEASAVAANTLIASEPLLRASTEAFGPDLAKQMVGELKNSIDRYLWEVRDSPEGRRRGATQRFLQGEQVPVRVGR